VGTKHAPKNSERLGDAVGSVGQPQCGQPSGLLLCLLLLLTVLLHGSGCLSQYPAGANEAHGPVSKSTCVDSVLFLCVVLRCVCVCLLSVYRRQCLPFAATMVHFRFGGTV
jgi:hypothetical protein